MVRPAAIRPFLACLSEMALGKSCTTSPSSDTDNRTRKPSCPEVTRKRISAVPSLTGEAGLCSSRTSSDSEAPRMSITLSGGTLPGLVGAPALTSPLPAASGMGGALAGCDGGPGLDPAPARRIGNGWVPGRDLDCPALAFQLRRDAHFAAIGVLPSIIRRTPTDVVQQLLVGDHAVAVLVCQTFLD